MAISDAAPLASPAPPTGPAERAPDDPVLLVGPAGIFDACGFSARLAARRWSYVHAVDAQRARWLTSIQRIALVVVAGDADRVRSVLDAVRSVTRAPVAVLGTFAPTAVVRLIEAGADAVVGSTGDPDEIFARIVTVLQRADRGWAPGVRYLRAGEVRVDLWSKQCDLGGRPVRLSPTEYHLLVFLMTHPLITLPVAQIVPQVWGWTPPDGTNALRIAMNRLRRKLGDDPRRPQYIGSTRGAGYRFVQSVREIGDDVNWRGDLPGEVGRLRSIGALAADLQHSTGPADAAARLLAAIEADGYADAMAVFQVAGERMVLMGERNNSDRWRSLVAGGLPLRPHDATGYSVLRGEIVAVSDIATAGQFSPTADRLVADGLRSCVFVPITWAGRVWGNLGLARRTRQPFDVAGLAYLRTACSVFSLALSAGQDATEGRPR